MSVKKFWRYISQTLVVIFLIVLSPCLVLGSNPVENPLAPPATHSPRDTLTQFLANTNEAYDLIMAAYTQGKKERGFFYSKAVLTQAHQAEVALERAVKTLSLEDVPPINRKEGGIVSALLLKGILDRINLPAIAQMPDEATVVAEGLTHWEIPNTEIAIVKIEDGFHTGEFLFSAETVKHLKTFYQKVQSLPYKPHASKGFYKFYISTPGNLLPPKWSNWLPGWTTILWGNQTIWQWFSLVVSLIVTSALVWFIRGFLAFKTPSHGSLGHVWSTLLLPLFIFIILRGEIFFITSRINITGGLRAIVVGVGNVSEIALLAWLSFAFLNAIGRTIIASPYFSDKLLEAIIVRNGARLLGFIAGTTIVYFGSAAIGLPLAPLLASLSLGSLAIGLGMRPYVENMVGGITLFLNRPMQIGDYCEFGGVAGTVEDIGLRATLIRTSDRKLITVPNTAISSSQLVNYSRRDKYTFTYTLGLTYDSVCDQVLPLMEQLRKQLAEHSMLANAKVSLAGLSGTSIDIDLFAHVLTTNAEEYNDIQLNLLLGIQGILDQFGAKLK